MKKIALFIGVLFVLPLIVSAQTVGFTSNLSYGSTGSEVSQLQEFLITQGVLASQYDTGNFYSLTLQAVKTFQTKEGIVPVSGFVGPITRGVINTILASEVPISEGTASTSTPPTDLSKIAPVTPIIPVTVPTTQTPVTPPITQPSAQQTMFGSVSLPPSCTLTGTTTPYTYSQLSGTIDWATQNTASLMLSDSSNSVKWNLTPIASGEIKDLLVQKNGTTFTATTDGGTTCSVTLP